jgi:hypothetical protein
VSIVPHKKYVGIIIESLVIAAEKATSLFEIYKLKRGLLNIITIAPEEIPMAVTKNTE